MAVARHQLIYKDATSVDAKLEELLEAPLTPKQQKQVAGWMISLSTTMQDLKIPPNNN